MSNEISRTDVCEACDGEGQYLAEGEDGSTCRECGGIGTKRASLSANAETAPVGDSPKARRRFKRPEMNRADALNHHQGWSAFTRAQVADEIDRVGGVEFRDNFSHHGYWNSVQVFDASGEFVADLMKTQIRYPRPYAPVGAEDRGSKDGLLVLSLDGVDRAGGAKTARRPEVAPKFCPNHPDVALPATGVCDDC